MDAKALLRRYLEQRRELGESELVLDGLKVEDVMRLLGATGSDSQSGAERRSVPLAGEGKNLAGGAGRSVRDLVGDQSDDWRTALQDAGVISEAKTSAPSGPSSPPETKATIRPAPIPRMAFPPEPVGPTGNGESTNETVSRKEIVAPRGIVVPRIEAQLMPGAIEKLDSLDEIAKTGQRLHALPAVQDRDQSGSRRRQSKGRSRLCRRSARREGRRDGAAVRRPGGPASHKDSRGDRPDARAGFHLQRAQAQAAGKQKSAARRGRSLQSVPDPAARADQAESDSCVWDLRSANSPKHKNSDRTAPWARASVPRHTARRHLSPRRAAAQSGLETPHLGRCQARP